MAGILGNGVFFVLAIAVVTTLGCIADTAWESLVDWYFSRRDDADSHESFAINRNIGYNAVHGQEMCKSEVAGNRGSLPEER